MRHYFLIIVLLLAANGIVWAANPCNMVSDEINKEIGQYETSPPICVMIHTNSSYSVKVRFWPEVDDFSALVIDKSHLQSFLYDPTDNSQDIEIQIQYQQSVSPRIKYSYYKSGKLYKVPFLTLLATFDGGVVLNNNAADTATHGLKWDTGCFGCEGDECSDDQQCAKEASQCGSFNDCDLKVYMAWLGTDKDGHYMTSAGSVLSRFRRYSVKGVYDSASKSSTPDAPSVSV